MFWPENKRAFIWWSVYAWKPGMHSQYGDKALECDFRLEPSIFCDHFSSSSNVVLVVLKLVEHGIGHRRVTSRQLFFIPICLQNATETTILGVRYIHGTYPSLQGSLLLWLRWTQIHSNRYRVGPPARNQDFLYIIQSNFCDPHDQKKMVDMVLLHILRDWAVCWV